MSIRAPSNEAESTTSAALSGQNDDISRILPLHPESDSAMDPSTLKIDASNHRLRRVGRLTRRRMRIEGANLTNGIHTDGRLSVVISGLGADGGTRPARSSGGPTGRSRS